MNLTATDILLTIGSLLLAIVAHLLKKLIDELHELKLDYIANKSITETNVKQTLKNEIKIENLYSGVEDIRLRVHTLEGEGKSILKYLKEIDDQIKEYNK